VPAGSLDQWKTRLRARGFTVTDVPPRFGEESVIVSDPSGLAMELIANNRDQRTPWRAGVPAVSAVRGLHSVTMTVRALRPTTEFMADLLGFEVVNEMDGRTRVAVNGDEPGKTIDIVHSAEIPPAVNGIGTVHHVAMAIADGDEQRRLRDEIVARGVQVTPVMDRQYFTSIYFREPGGVLFEVATLKPGFAIDEDVTELGRSLKLPPDAEADRNAIEQALPIVHY
jgi:glyoxalase family protein